MTQDSPIAERTAAGGRSACPVLDAFVTSLSEALSDDDRQMLVPFLPRLIGTRSTPEVESARVWMAT